MATITYLGQQRIRPGVAFQISALCRANDGTAETGLGPTFAIRNAAGDWWSVAGTAFGGAKVDNPLTEVDDPDLPGVYSATVDALNLDPSGGEARYFIEVTGGAGITDVMQVEAVHDLASLKIVDGVIADPVVTLPQLLLALKVMLTHNSEIDDTSKREIHYREDGVTPAVSFDLKDAAGLASVREPFRKERV